MGLLIITITKIFSAIFKIIVLIVLIIPINLWDIGYAIYRRIYAVYKKNILH